ncbi:PRC-barrel domain-containing protein [Candidatus Saccharibacteria bacterium]|nr:PRC-barrel domain-containing protein [Candidatus Saccharibacteria bacterium]
MLVNGSRLKNFPVLSLHLGGPAARTQELIVDPKKFQIVGFYVDGASVRNGESGNILESNAVREYSKLGMIVDSTDDFVNEGDVIRLDEIIKLRFKLDGLKVITKKKTKLGKVVDFTVDTENFKILQIIVQRPPLKAFIDPELVISRKEIVEISNEKIVVKDEEEKIRKKAMKEDFVPNFVNPFREPNFAPADSQSPGGRDS